MKFIEMLKMLEESRKAATQGEWKTMGDIELGTLARRLLSKYEAFKKEWV